MPLFSFILILYIRYVHSITCIQYIHPSSFAEVTLHLIIAGQLSALQQADELPTELRRTLRIYDAHWTHLAVHVSFFPIEHRKWQWMFLLDFCVIYKGPLSPAQLHIKLLKERARAYAVKQTITRDQVGCFMITQKEAALAVRTLFYTRAKVRVVL